RVEYGPTCFGRQKVRRNEKQLGRGFPDYNVKQPIGYVSTRRVVKHRLLEVFGPPQFTGIGSRLTISGPSEPNEPAAQSFYVAKRVRINRISYAPSYPSA